MNAQKLLLGLLIVGLASSVQAAPLPRYGNFVFSGLCTDPETGKPIGSRLTILRLNQHDHIFYEWGDLFEPGKNLNPYRGAKPSPRFGTNVAPGLYGAAAVTVRIESSGRLIADFDPSNRNPPRTVTGELSEDGFILSGYEARIRLPRQRDPGARIPACDRPIRPK